MPTYLECVSCKEISQILAKISEANDPSVTWITQHPGSNAVCLIVVGPRQRHRQEKRGFLYSIASINQEDTLSEN